MNKTTIQSTRFNFVWFCIFYMINSSVFFSGNRYLRFFAFSFLILFIFGIKKTDSKVKLIILINNMLIVIQGLMFGFKLLTFFTYPLLMIFIPYQIYKQYKSTFFEYYLKLIYFFSIFTSIIWILEKNISIVRSFIRKMVILLHPYSTDVWPRSLIIYTSVFSTLPDISRNAGIAHEPGAWAFYLTFAISLNNIIRNEFFSKRNIIMILGLISTFSTTGYIMLFMVLTLWLFSLKQKNNFVRMSKMLIIPLFLFLSYFLYNQLDFLGDKINKHVETQMEGDLDNRYSTGRFIRLRKGLNVAIHNPIFGRGIITASSEEDMYSASKIPSGYLVGVLAQYGFIFGILYLYFLYKGSVVVSRQYNVTDIRKYSLFLILIINGFSQAQMYNYLALMLFYAGLFYKKQQMEIGNVQK